MRILFSGRRPLVAWLLFGVLLVACGPAGGGVSPGPTGTPLPTGTAPRGSGPITVFAASSLTESLTAVGKGWAQAGARPQFNFGGSQALLAQLQQGARGDVLVTADKPTMDKAVASGLVETPVALARNLLVVAVPEANAAHVATIGDLARPGLKVVLAAPAVPAGNYSLQVLDKLSATGAYGRDFKTKVIGNVVSQEDTVRQVLTKVQLGEADAGIVYRTDVQAANAVSGAAGRVQMVAIPDAANVVAVYYIAALRSAAQPVGARAFVAYARSAAGQAVFQQYGFLPALSAAEIPSTP